MTLLLWQQPLLAHPGASSSIEHYSHQIEHSPQTQALYISRGIAYSNDGRYEEALADFRRAGTLGDPVTVSFDLGVLHYRKGEFDAALGYFNQYLERFPNHAGCIEYRARLLRDSGDVPGAVADFRRLFELRERPNPGHYISAAQLLVSTRTQGVSPALALLDSGIDKLGVIPQLQAEAIRLERSRGRLDLAIARHLALQPQLGDSPNWKVEMASLRLESDETDKARELLDDAAAQLQVLRKTPARQALGERITKLYPTTP